MGTGLPQPKPSDLEALERFVVENDELLELELVIGKFNVFDALNVARVEIRHSNFLAWLLDPAESHGQGQLFLKALLMDLLKDCPLGLRPFSPVELDGVQLRGVDVRREWRNIDVLIACREPPFIVCIENKVDSGERGDQLERYQSVVRREYPDLKALYVFLTREGEEPSSEEWVPYSYAQIYRVLDRCRKTNTGSIGGDVLVFLDHYLRLIGSRFMDDPKIDDLCQQIYRNHRQALDLIYERVGAPGAKLVGELEDLLNQQPDRWLVCHRTSKEVHFVPRAWLDVLPPIGRRQNVDPKLWIRLGFWCGEDKCLIWCWGYPTTDPVTRRAALERLTRDFEEFHLRAPKKGITDTWTSLGSETVFSWQDEEEPDKAALIAAASKKLDEFWERLAPAPAALSEVLREQS